MFKYNLNLILLTVLMSGLFSCVNMKPVIYFDNIKDSTILVDAANLEPIIQKNDLLGISISSLNPEATQIFNIPNATSTGSGYLVNQEGNIQFPLLGTIKAAGITKKKLREDISKSLVERQLLLDPIVDVRYLNYKVTVLGEVSNPTVLTVPSEKISIMEAIGLAGDLRLSANRSNVMIVREEEGKKTIKRLDLTSSKLLTSPYYYLKPNDIVYIVPNKLKVEGTSRFSRIFPVIMSTVSFGVLIFDRINR